jgi:hypothetical protein
MHNQFISKKGRGVVVIANLVDTYVNLVQIILINLSGILSKWNGPMAIHQTISGTVFEKSN